MRIVKSVTFDAAHYLKAASPADRDAPAGNQHPYGRLHGHSFLLEVELRGKPDEVHGWVADFGELTQSLEAVRARLDHCLLNEVEGLGAPTLENICLFVAEILRPDYPGLSRVSVSRPSNGEGCHYHL